VKIPHRITAHWQIVATSEVCHRRKQALGHQAYFVHVSSHGDPPIRDDQTVRPSKRKREMVTKDLHASPRDRRWYDFGVPEVPESTKLHRSLFSSFLFMPTIGRNLTTRRCTRDLRQRTSTALLCIFYL